MKKMMKGQYETAVEMAKKLLDKGTGTGEIEQLTRLDADEIAKIKKNRIDKS